MQGQHKSRHWVSCVVYVSQCLHCVNTILKVNLKCGLKNLSTKCLILYKYLNAQTLSTLNRAKLWNCEYHKNMPYVE